MISFYDIRIINACKEPSLKSPRSIKGMIGGWYEGMLKRWPKKNVLGGVEADGYLPNSTLFLLYQEDYLMQKLREMHQS
jgi:hypothetical protein